MLNEHRRRLASSLEAVLEARISGDRSGALLAEASSFRLLLDIGEADSLDPELERLAWLERLATSSRLGIEMRLGGRIALALELEARAEEAEARLLELYPWLEEAMGKASSLLLSPKARREALGQ